jgi:hypothetical protein
VAGKPQISAIVTVTPLPEYDVPVRRCVDLAARRRHQYRARLSHYQRRLKLQHVRLEY